MIEWFEFIGACLLSMTLVVAVGVGIGLFIDWLVDE